MSSIEICDSPIFVLGAPRSGTSMMQWALRQHPHLWGGQESDYLIPLVERLRELWEFGSRRERLHWLSGQRVSFDEFVGHVGTGINSLYMSRSRGNRWVEQTPQYTLHLHDMVRLFPGAQFVVMVRDGRQVVESLRRFVNPVGFDDACRLWRRFNEEALDFATDHGDRMHFVRYERVVTETGDALAELLDFLGEPCSEASVAHIRDKAPINSSFGDEDSRRKVAGRWMTWTPEEKLTFVDIAGEMLVELGYEQDSAWVTAESVGTAGEG
ncbi:sulfotransferase [bacterium]|nr:sulfotransferase [bacterium]